MEALFLFSIMAAAAGALVGWFHKRSSGNLGVKIFITTLGLFAITALLLDGPPASYSPRYLFSGLLYLIYPYLMFIFLPAIAAATVISRIHDRLISRRTSDHRRVSTSK